jgi:hypothetical protein
MKLTMTFFLSVFFGLITYTSLAQETKIINVAKFKPPAVKTYLGVNTNGATVTVQEASELAGLPLKVTDDKKNIYTVTSYGFIYKRKGVIEDEESGGKKIAFTTLADKFNETPLPKIWIDNLKDGFQKDEELYFYDILVKDDKGRKFFAPDLKITIQ